MPERNYFYRQPPVWRDLQSDISHFAIVTPPSTEPVSVSDLKKHLRIDCSDEDDLLAAMITAARQWVEITTWTAMMTQTWQCNFRRARGTYDLPNPPIQSITKIEYLDTSATKQTLASTYYTLDSMAGRIVITTPQPAVCGGRDDAIQITYSCGYATIGSIPMPLIQAVKHLAGFYWLNRDGSEDVPPIIERLLSPYKRLGIA